MPYDVMRRLFAATESPDLSPVFDQRLVELRDDGSWRIPIILTNQSSAVANHTKVVLKVLNPDSCEAMSPEAPFRDVSAINPGQTMFLADITDLIFRGLNYVGGALIVRMRRGPRPRRVLELEIVLHSERMRSRRWTMRLHLTRTGLAVRQASSSYLY